MQLINPNQFVVTPSKFTYFEFVMSPPTSTQNLKKKKKKKLDSWREWFMACKLNLA
jgi:hypothetical protein